VRFTVLIILNGRTVLAVFEHQGKAVLQHLDHDANVATVPHALADKTA
jgi:hypothetical protein